MAAPSHPDIPRLGDLVYYYDEDKHVYAATVAFVNLQRIGKDGVRPFCSLAILKHNGYQSPKPNTPPAFHDGKRWHILNKWSWPDEVPTAETNPFPSDSQAVQSNLLTHSNMALTVG